MAQRRITVSYETIRRSCIRFGAKYTRRLTRKHQGYGDTFYRDEVFVRIGGQQHYLWRAVDQDGEVVDVFLQRKRDATAAKRFFKRLRRSHGEEPRKIVTDKPGSYAVAHRELLGNHVAVRNLFNLGRHLVRAQHYRNLRDGAFERWTDIVT